MKYSIGIVFVLMIIIVILRFYKSNSLQIQDPPNQLSLDDNAEKMIALFNCDYEVFENASNIGFIMNQYKKYLSKGKKEGFTPLIMIPTDRLLEMMEINLDGETFENYRKNTMEKADSIDVEKLLQSRFSDSIPTDGDDVDIYGDVLDVSSLKEFISLNDYDTKKPYKQIFIFMIPTTNPWELAAWIPMGGFNDCPFPEEQIAVFKYWYEKYGAVPAVAQYDIWEFYLQQPVHDEKSAMKLAEEQFAFCSDIVWQGVGSINTLAKSMIDSSVWYFWWD